MTGRTEITKYDWKLAVTKFKGLSHQASVLRVAELICHYVKSDIGLAWPTRQTLALELDIHESRVSSAIATLRECGALQVVKFADLPVEIRAVTGNRSGKGQAYRLNMEWAQAVLKCENKRVKETQEAIKSKAERSAAQDVQFSNQVAERSKLQDVQNTAERLVRQDVHGVERLVRQDAYTLTEALPLEILSSDSGGAHIMVKKEAPEKGESAGNIVTLPSPKESEMSDHDINRDEPSPDSFPITWLKVESVSVHRSMAVLSSFHLSESKADLIRREAELGNAYAQMKAG